MIRSGIFSIYYVSVMDYGGGVISPALLTLASLTVLHKFGSCFCDIILCLKCHKCVAILSNVRDIYYRKNWLEKQTKDRLEGFR